MKKFLNAKYLFATFSVAVIFILAIELLAANLVAGIVIAAVLGILHGVFIAVCEAKGGFPLYFSGLIILKSLLLIYAIGVGINFGILILPVMIVMIINIVYSALKSDDDYFELFF